MERKFNQPYTKPRFASRHDYHPVKMLGVAPTVIPKELLAISRLIIQSAENCTAYTAVALREPITGAQYDPEKQWQAELARGATPQGATIDIQLDTAKNVGFFKVGETTPTDSYDGYFFVLKEGQDWFDSCRSEMTRLYQKYGKVIPFSIGLNWYAEWDNTPHGIIPDSGSNLLGGHDTKIAGFQNFNIDGVDYIVIQGSWGPGYGDNGIFRANRQVFNKWFDVYGAGYGVDDKNLNVQRLGIFLQILQNIKTIFQLFVKNQNTIGYPPPKNSPPLWDTWANCRHSVRVICDEEGLSWNDKNVMCACVEVESNFNPKAQHANKDKAGIVWSTDYGICQVNDYFHIGEGKDFPSIDYVLENPEASVRFMCRLWKAGQQHLWSSYTSKAYLQYL